MFNATTGKFQQITSEQHFQSKGVPADSYALFDFEEQRQREKGGEEENHSLSREPSAGRQMNHFFDLEAFQEQKRREKELGLKPKRIKNWRELKVRLNSPN
jgi:hypothetical protein